MKQYTIELNGKQYSILEKMLCYDNAQCIAMNQPIRGYDLFSDILDDIYSPVEDGWSTLDIVLQESDEKLELLREMTASIFPDDKDYFINQLGNEEIACKDNFSILITIK